MPFDGSGNFTRNFPPGGWQGDATSGIKIRADRHDQHDSDLASGLSNALCKDGQSSPTADINWNGKKIVNLGAPINPNDAATKAYADISKPFNTAISINGSFPDSMIKFTGAVGPWGSQYPDLFWGVRAADAAAVPPTYNRMVLNDKADSTGTDVFSITESGLLKTMSQEFVIDSNLFFNLYADAGLYKLRAAGAGARIQHNGTTNGAIDFFSAPTGIVNADTATTLKKRFSIGTSNTEVYTNTFSISNLASPNYQLIITPGDVLVYNCGGSYHQFQINGAVKAQIASNVTFQVWGGNSNHTAVFNAPFQAGYMGVYGLGVSLGAAVYGQTSSIIGGLAQNVSGEGTWGVYTNGSGKATGGSWTTSDERTKTNMTDVDTAAAVAQVMAIPVINYEQLHAIMMETTGEHFLGANTIGWRASDIAPVIPQAVMEVEAARQDVIERAVLKGMTSLPAKDSPEELALMDEPIKVKVMNDHAMLATLWAAFQHQTGVIEALQAKVTALEAA